jgi:hypothetical protein
MPALEPVTRHFDEVRARAADKVELVTLSVMAFLRAGSWSKVLTQRLADLLFGMSYPTLERALIVEDRTITQKHLAELALALAAYRGEQGKYPEDLSALKPKYLREIPDDRFTDKPLQYRLVGKGYLLYSVGEDMRDDGGKEGVGEGSDIVVRVE